MTNKQNFTPEDWTKILESVALSGVAVTAADPSGLMGLLKESFASANASFPQKKIPVLTNSSSLSSPSSRRLRAVRGFAKP